MTNPIRFQAELALEDVVPAGFIGERVYGDIRVTAAWQAGARATLEVFGDLDPRDAPAYVELFFHDVFLLLNLASPGSFGGTISILGGELRVRELSFNAGVFAAAAHLATVPLDGVVRWYDGLQLATRQIAADGVAIALFQLLHLARAPEREEDSILRLAIAVEALGCRSAASPRLFELREEIAFGRTPTIHPMHDDALDPRVEDVTREWIDVADAAMQLVIETLRELCRAGVSA